MFRTEHLQLRNLRQEDVPGICAWRQDPECARYQRWEDTSEAAVAAFVKNMKTAVSSQKRRNSTTLSVPEMPWWVICPVFTRKQIGA